MNAKFVQSLSVEQLTRYTLICGKPRRLSENIQDRNQFDEELLARLDWNPTMEWFATIWDPVQEFVKNESELEKMDEVKFQAVQTKLWAEWFPDGNLTRLRDVKTMLTPFSSDAKMNIHKTVLAKCFGLMYNTLFSVVQNALHVHSLTQRQKGEMRGFLGDIKINTDLDNLIAMFGFARQCLRDVDDTSLGIYTLPDFQQSSVDVA